MFIMWSTLLLNSSFKSNQGFRYDLGLIVACYIQSILLIGILLYVKYFEKSLISSTNYFQTGYLWMLCLITIAYKLWRRIPNFFMNYWHLIFVIPCLKRRKFFVGHKRGILPQVIICKKSQLQLSKSAYMFSHNYLWPLNENSNTVLEIIGMSKIHFIELLFFITHLNVTISIW